MLDQVFQFTNLRFLLFHAEFELLVQTFDSCQRYAMKIAAIDLSVVRIEWKLTAEILGGWSNVALRKTLKVPFGYWQLRYAIENKLLES